MPIHTASATRWLRQYQAPILTPRYSAAADAAAANLAIQTIPWRMLRRELMPSLPAPHSDLAMTPEALDNYDAYLACGEHSEDEVMHRVFTGCACYRIELPAAAAGIPVETVIATVSTDAYTPDGARVAVRVSDDPAPSEDWDVIRAGDFHAAGACPRLVSSDGKYWNGNTVGAVISPEGGFPPGRFIHIYLTLERGDRSRNAWVEGSACIVPEFKLVFSAPVPGFADGHWIGGGYDMLSPAEVAGGDGLTVSIGGAIHGMAPAAGETTREAVSLSLEFGRPPEPGADAGLHAIAAWPALSAALASAGAEAAPADPALAGGQSGLACRIVHTDVSPSRPLTQRLAYIASPVGVVLGLTPGLTPRELWLGATAAATVAGAEVWLSIYWVAGKLLTPAKLGELAAKPEALFGEKAVTLADNARADQVGTAAFPASIEAGGGMRIPLTTIPRGRYGTLVIVPRLGRITAERLAAGGCAGIIPAAGQDPSAHGPGLLPDIKLLY